MPVIFLTGSRNKSFAMEATVAQLRGDEFAILVENITKSEDAAMIAEKVIVFAGQPMRIGGKNITIGASIGIAGVATTENTSQQTICFKRL